ncbi:MAG TPA: alpha/beta fold hydrolase [Pseudonocardiaceae bacterium]|nr:alpha/beta fold hydrolase [Pseudonocardiaceae bacterium]
MRGVGRGPRIESVTTDDGRRLTIDVTGDPDGYPVFLLHGTPGSRNGPKPRGIVLYRLGLQLICYDRPGYGGSDRHEGRTVRDAAADVATIADKMGFDRFAVVGRSGGGPHALACAAVLSERVSSAAVLVSLAPSDAVGLDWYHGMNRQNVQEYGTADADVQALLSNLAYLTEQTQRDPRRFIDLIESELSESDKRVVGDVALRRLLLDTYAEALRQGAAGWIDDVLAFRKPWEIALSNITSRVLLWHSEDDQFSPISHTRWLSGHIPQVQVEFRIQAGIGHFGALEVLPEILSWVADGLDEPDQGITFRVVGSGRAGS